MSLCLRRAPFMQTRFESAQQLGLVGRVVPHWFLNRWTESLRKASLPYENGLSQRSNQIIP